MTAHMEKALSIKQTMTFLHQNCPGALQAIDQPHLLAALWTKSLAAQCMPKNTLECLLP